MIRRIFVNLPRIEDTTADAQQQPSEIEFAQCRKTDAETLSYHREEMRQDDIDSLMDGWEDEYDRIERPY